MSWQTLVHRYWRHAARVVENDNKQYPSCHTCKFPISSNQFYKCNHKKCDFKEHISCSDLPSEIHHPCYSNHPLMLNYWEEELIECRICGDLINTRSDVFYECKICRPKFRIDIICAVLVRRGFTVEHRSHPQHPLLPMGEKALFLCQGCGVKHYDSPLMCNLCEFWIARSCAQLPSTFMAEDHHEHLLQLKYSAHNKSGDPSTTSDLDHDRQGDRVACRICAKPINHRFWVYECGGCRYFAHVQCAISGTEAFISDFNI